MSLTAQILALTASELADAVARGAIAAVEATRAYLARIEDTAPRLRAFVRVAPERALAEAAAIDAARRRGEPLGPLCGVPYGLKDSLVTAGIETTAGSPILAGWIPPYDGAHVRRLRAAGAVLLGKLALDEFGMGSHGIRGPGPAARNPWSLGHVPGGSSSGAAVAVAGRAAAFALGSDTGGSIRVPAARCGVVGLRPTWGRVSRAGLVAFASSLDAVGPLTRDVADAARVLTCLAGHDEEDSSSLAADVPDYGAAVAAGRAGTRAVVGFDPAALARVEPAVAAAFTAALAVLREAGAEIVEVALPAADEALLAYAALSAAEAASNLARYDGVRYGLSVARDSYEASVAATRGHGFGLEVKRRLVLGTLLQRRPELLARAQAARARVTAGMLAALSRCDALASPTTVEAGIALASLVRGGGRAEVASDSHVLGDSFAELAVLHVPGDSFTSDHDVDRFTVAASLAGLPALSLPMGLAPGPPALPIGLHLVGRRLGEAELLALAAAFAARSPWRVTPPEGS